MHQHRIDFAGVCTGPGPCDTKSLDRSPRSNFVERGGGLPLYIRAIANSLHREKGMPLSRAIPTAISTVKRWAAGGGDVTTETRARAAAAVAQWEALKAKAHSLSATEDDVIDLAGHRGPLSAAHRLAISMALRRRGRTPGLDPYIRHPRTRRLVDQNTGSFGRSLARARGGSRQAQLDAMRRQARARRVSDGPGQRQTPQQLTQRINNLPEGQRQAIRSRASAPAGFQWNSRHMLEPAAPRAPRAEPNDHAEQRRAVESVRRRAGVPAQGRPRPRTNPNGSRSDVSPSDRRTPSNPNGNTPPRTPGARVMQGNETINLREHMQGNRPAPASTNRAARTTPQSRSQARDINTQSDQQREEAFRLGVTPQGYHWRNVAGRKTLIANTDSRPGRGTALSADGTSVTDLTAKRAALRAFLDLAPARQARILDLASGGPAGETAKARDKRISKAGGYDSNQGLKAQGAAGQKADGDFNSKHPRAGAGSPTGGQFIAAGSGGDNASQSETEQIMGVEREIGVEADGVFSQQDADALKSWQKKQGLVADGKVGSQTASRMSDGPDVGPGGLRMSDRAHLQKRGSAEGARSTDGRKRNGTATDRTASFAARSTAVDLAAAPPQLMRAVMAMRKTKDPQKRKRLATAIRSSAVHARKVM